MPVRQKSTASAEAHNDEPLLAFLDARFRLTGGIGSALKGTICVGIRRDGHTRWWVANVGKRTSAAFAKSLPTKFDAGVLLDESTAAWVLGAAPERGHLHLVTGDQVLLRRFLDGHVGHISPLGMRLREASAK